MGLVVGAAAGLCALFLDRSLARWLAGLSVFVPLHLAAAYPAVGAAFGLLSSGWLHLRTPRMPSDRLDRWVAVFGLSFLLLYSLPVLERLEYLQRSEAPDLRWLVWPLVVVVPAAMLGFAWLLRRLATPEAHRKAHAVPERHLGWSAVLAAACAAAGLAVNRFVVARPTEPGALAADAGLVIAALGLAWVYRRVLSRRPALACLVFASAFAAIAGLAVVRGDRSPVPTPSSAEVDADRPHLLLLVIDTLRADTFEDVLQSTPEGARLREVLGAAAYFREAVAVAPWTAPTMGTILTGLYPEEHGFVAQRDRPGWAHRTLAPGVRTLADVLADAGYWTEAIGANPILNEDTGIHRGFAEYHLLPGPTIQLPLLTAMTRVGKLRHEFYQPGEALARRFETRLPAAVASGRPFFFWLQLMDPHAPLYGHPGLPAAPGVEPVAAWTQDEVEIQRLYRDEVRYAVDQAARCLEAVAEAGALDRTAVVLVADHGEQLPGDRHWDPRLRGAHGHGHTLHESVVRVPLVIRPPGGLEAARWIDGLVSQVDLYDTMLDLLSFGEEEFVGRDRRSLRALWNDGADRVAPSGRRWALLGSPLYGPPQSAVRTPRHKLVHWPLGLPSPKDLAAAGRPARQRALRRQPPPEGDETWQLYGLVKDPEERRNLVGKPSAEEMTRRLQELLETELGALQPAPEDPAAGDPAEPVDEELRRQLEALGYVG